MSHSVVLNLRLVLFGILLILRPVGLGRGFECEHQTSGVEPVLVCSDEGSGAEDHVARVALRKMPRWGSHAGLTLIDFCLIPRAAVGSRFDDHLKFDSPQLDPKSSSNGPSGACERKYCTDVNRAHSVFVNSIPFPVGWTSVSFWLGYRNQSFSIHCDELIDESEIQ